MYFKVSLRTNPLTGKTEGYYRLVESYRNTEGRVCHRTLLNVGYMDDVPVEDLNRIQKLLNHKCQTGNELFGVEYEKESAIVRKWENELYGRLLKEKRIDVPESKSSGIRQGSGDEDWETINTKSIKNKDIREIGGEWLCYQALEQLGVGRYLSSRVNWSGEDVRLALTHIISRAVYPGSELKTSRWIRENSAVCELTGFPREKINKDRLYAISKQLYSVKEDLETYLSHRTDELFDIEDKIILYDLTNTYFEGAKRSSQLARFGRSKEKRSDCKIVVLALVINPFGFIKYSSLLQGNIADPATLEKVIRELRGKTSTTAEKALVVIDAGIATRDNLSKIREEGYDYLCVSRNRLKDYKIVEGASLTVEDNRKRKIQLQKVVPAKSAATGSDYYLKVESPSKKKKETSMNELFRDGYLKGLGCIAGSLTKKRGVKVESKVHQRVGRLMQKYPSIHKYYQIDYQVEERTIGKRKPAVERIVTSMTWTLKGEMNMDGQCGIYFLQTSLVDENRILWDSYNTLREIESTFRVLKTDLDMRPIFHKKDDSTMAHLHLAILAYWVVNTIRHQLKEKGINHQWNEIVRLMNTQKAVTTVAQNNCEQIIHIRRCSEPNEKVLAIYQTLGYKSTPFKTKKVVVHKSLFKNFDDSLFQVNNSS
jgi:hypothetical protein